MRQKGFAPVLVILVIAILGVVGYWGYKNILPKTQVSLNPVSSQTSNTDISGWKTYTNDKLGFSYRYPNDWQLDTTSGLFDISSKKDGTIIQVHYYQVSDLPKGYSSTTLWFNDLSNKKQKAILPNDGYYYGPGGDNPYKWYMYYNFDNFENTKIDNIASILTHSNTGLMYMIVPTKNYIYEITTNPISAYGTPVVNQILSTFKFAE